MARPEKVAVVEDVRDRLANANAAVLTEYRGLSVAELATLRSRLRESEAEYRVLKNTLTRIASRDAGFDIPDEVLTGPTAITFCAGDPVAAAKVLRSFSREHPALVIKGGILEGRVLSAEETTSLADLESREEMLAKLAGMMQTIIAQPARLAIANLEKAARLFAALQDKLPAEPEPSEPAAAATPAEPEPAAAAAEADSAEESESADAGEAGDERPADAPDPSPDNE
jgi:large subunit ribosomal protein L10